MHNIFLALILTLITFAFSDHQMCSFPFKCKVGEEGMFQNNKCNCEKTLLRTSYVCIIEKFDICNQVKEVYPFSPNQTIYGFRITKIFNRPMSCWCVKSDKTNSISESTESNSNFFVDFGSFLSQKFKEGSNTLSDSASKIGNTFDKTVNNIGKSLDKYLDKFAKHINNITSDLKDSVDEISDSLKDSVENSVDTFFDNIHNVIDRYLIWAIIILAGIIILVIFVVILYCYCKYKCMKVYSALK